MKRSLKYILSFFLIFYSNLIVADCFENNYPCFRDKVSQLIAYNGNNIWNQQMLDEFNEQLFILQLSNLAPQFNTRISYVRSNIEEIESASYQELVTDSFILYKIIIKKIHVNPHVLFTSKLLKVNTVGNNLPNMDPLINYEQLLKLRPLKYNYQASLVYLKKLNEQQDIQIRLNQGLIRHNKVIPYGKQLIEKLNFYNDLDDFTYEYLSTKKVILNQGEVNLAIKNFQRRNGLKVDGVIGNETIRALNNSFSNDQRILALNMQRTRLKKMRAPIYLYVNVPDFKLQVFRNYNKVFESKVITGRYKRPTGLFSSEMRNIVINPTWNVPEGIKKKDIIPNVKRNIHYLRKNKINIIRSWQNPRKISPYSINWRNVNARNFPFQFQQTPGRHNSLGKVKFDFPNNFAIFLHDTSSKNLFMKDKRALSSGCVRVENAVTLAEYLLQFEGYSSNQISNYVNSRRTKYLKISKPIYIQMMYITSWVDENDILHKRPDIYGYDKKQSYVKNINFVSMKHFQN
ncbi:hypothetical protein PAMA111031_11270 [Paraphotobacterium marinum]